MVMLVPVLCQGFWRCSLWIRKLKQYGQEAVNVIIEEEKKDVQSIDSEVESEDGKSYERAELQIKRST